MHCTMTTFFSWSGRSNSQGAAGTVGLRGCCVYTPLLASAFTILLLMTSLSPMRSTAQRLPKSRAGAVTPAADYEAVFTTILREVVTDSGLVRYSRLRGDLKEPFLRVVRAIETFDLSSLVTDEEKFAFWFNAYNVQMLKNVTDTPHVRNILLGGYARNYFRKSLLTGGIAISLDDIEHTILRHQGTDSRLQVYRPSRVDPRLHVALNCAAVSCPRLRRQAYTASTLHADLEDAMREFAGSTTHFRAEEDNVVISSILKWYGPDFDSADTPAGDLILRYMSISHPDYDVLRAALAGRTSRELRDTRAVKFTYRWRVNRAP